MSHPEQVKTYCYRPEHFLLLTASNSLPKNMASFSAELCRSYCPLPALLNITAEILHCFYSFSLVQQSKSFQTRTVALADFSVIVPSVSCQLLHAVWSPQIEYESYELKVTPYKSITSLRRNSQRYKTLDLQALFLHDF